MLDRVIGALSEATGDRPVLVVGRTTDSPRGEGVDDLYPGEGPLGGLLTAFASTDQDVIVGAACDLPNLSRVVVDELVRARYLTDADLAVPLVGGVRQWQLVAWHRRSEQHLRSKFLAGERSIWRAARSLCEAVLVTERRDLLRDVDTPEDLAQVSGQRDRPVAATIEG